jgi:predicted metal-dependent HD superfamily phosphohydrolase
MKNKKITEITDSIKLTQLKENFFEIFGKYTDEIKVKKLWKQFVRIYTGPSRHYHNIHHIAHMVNLWKVNHSLLEKSDEIFFAIIYHDVVYRSRWKNNERKSALFFHKKVWPLLITLSEGQSNIVFQAIEATKHDGTILNPLYLNDFQMLLDFDLEILSTHHEDEYEWYRKGVRKEYIHFPLKKYKAGRKLVLEKFLARPQMFLTQTFKINEKKARKNLRNEIKLYLCDNKK